MSNRKHVAWLAGGIAICVANLSSTAAAQTTSPQGGPQDAEKAALARSLDQYATIAGGWFLDNRCKFLNTELRRELDWDFAQTSIALSSKVKPSFLNGLHPAAKKVADGYACDDKARSVVARVLALSRQTTLDLTGKAYSALNQPEFAAQRTAWLLAAKSLDDRCHAMPHDARVAYDRNLQAITDGLAAAAGAPTLDSVRAKADGIDNNKIDCVQDSPLLLMSASLEARAMSQK
jgi:hypothetical protein